MKVLFNATFFLSSLINLYTEHMIVIQYLTQGILQVESGTSVI